MEQEQYQEPQQETKNRIDDLILDRQLLMLKAAIPYISGSSQKTVAFLEKFMELRRTVSLFDNPETSMQICSLPETEEPLPLQMLEAIRGYCTPQEQETIDMLQNYVQMFSAYETLFA